MTALGKRLAPEDIEVKQWVAPLTFSIQVPEINSYLGPPTLEALEVELDAAGCIPMRVIAICLPFVTVKCGKWIDILDTRHVQFIRLKSKFAKATLKAFNRALKHASSQDTPT